MKIPQALKCAALMLAIAAVSPLAAAGARAAFPEKPIKIVAPFRAGGATHTLTKLVGAALEKTIGQTVVVTAVSGGGGAIGSGQVARARPDGYTLLMGSNGTLGVRWQISSTGFTHESFVPLGRVALVPLGWAVRSESPVTSLPQLVARLKRNPRTKYTSVGTGSIVHVFSEQWADLAGVRLVHIANRGGRGAIVKLFSKEVDFIVVSATNFPPYLKGGKSAKGGLRPLAVSSSKRWKYAPEIPTMKELGYDFSGVAWWGLWAPKGTPKAVQETLSAAIEKAVNSPAMTETFKKFYFTPAYASPQETWKILLNDIKDGRAILKKIGMYKMTRKKK